LWFTASLILLLVFGRDSFGQTHTAPDAAGKALHAIEQGRLSEAEALLEEAVRAEPSNANYAFALANVYLVSGKPKLAIPVLQKCLRLTPGDWEARIALAQAYQKVDADSEALRTLGTVPPPGRRAALWRFSRAFSLYRLGDARGAEPLFKQLLENKEMQAPANFFLANCYSEMTKYGDALPYYETAIEYGQGADNKALNIYYYNYGLTLFKLGRYDKARDAFEKSAQRFADDPLPWYYLGRCEVQLGNFERARAAFETAIEKNNSFNPAYYQLARLYAAHGDRAKAEELYGKVSKELHRQLKESEQLKFGNSQ
jgi:tetratricopeptide (TPR) repeat protein